MYYQSTRSSHTANSLEAVIRGIAPDGGLYVDPDIAARPFDWRRCLTLDEFDMAEMLLSHLLPDFEDMGALVERAYHGKFENEHLSPLVRAGDAWVLELFRGPTSAFKDVALSMLPQLITKAREQLGITERIVILTATSCRGPASRSSTPTAVSPPCSARRWSLSAATTSMSRLCAATLTTASAA